MMFKTLFVAFALLSSQQTLAQTNSSIRTGRPGQAIGTYVVGTGYLQIQSGVDLSNNAGSKKETTLVNNVVRLGLSESVELSSIVNYQRDKRTLGNQELTQSGISSTQLGFRVNLIDRPKGWIPGMGFQIRWKTTATEAPYRTNNTATKVIFATHHKLSDSVAFVLNLTMNNDGQTAVTEYGHIANLSFPISGNWSSFIETYGTEKAGVSKQYIDTGIGYSVNDNLQFDIYSGWGKNQRVEESFVSFGISWRSLVF